MAIPAGTFDPTIVPVAWFDPTQKQIGWFDPDLVDNTGGGGATQYTQAVGGTLAPAATLQNRTGKNGLAGTMPSAGAIVKRTAKSPAGVFTSAGTLAKQAGKVVAGTLTSAGVLVKQTTKVLAGTMPSSGVLSKRTGKNGLAGTLTSGGALVKQTGKVLAGTMTSSGVLTATKVALLALTGTLTSAGSLSKKTLKNLAGTMGSAGSLVKQTGKNGLGGTLTSAGAIVKRTAKNLAGTLTSSGTMTTSRVSLLAVTGTLTSAGSLLKQTGKALAGGLPSSGVLTKQTQKVLAGTLATGGGLVKLVAKVLAGTMTSSGALAKTKAVLKSLTGTLFHTNYFSYAKSPGYLLPAFGSAGYYRLDSAGGATTFTDQGGNSVTVNIVGGVTLQQVGATLDGNAAALFNGTTGYGVNASGAAFDPMAGSPVRWTVSCWFNHQAAAWAAGGETLVSYGSKHRLVATGGVNPVLSIVFTINGVAQTVSLTSPPISGWHQVVATWFSGDFIRLYLDGTLVATSNAAITGTLDSGVGSKGVGFAVDDALGTPARFYAGLLDEIEWSGNQWTTAQVAALYAIGAGSGQLRAQAQKALAGTMTTAGVVGKRTTASLGAVLSLAGTLTKRTARAVSGVLAFIGTVTANVGGSVIFSGLVASLTARTGMIARATVRTATTVTQTIRAMLRAKQ